MAECGARHSRPDGREGEGAKSIRNVGLRPQDSRTGREAAGWAGPENQVTSSSLTTAQNLICGRRAELGRGPPHTKSSYSLRSSHCLSVTTDSQLD